LIIVIPILIYIAITSALVWIVNLVWKNKDQSARKRIRVWMIGTSAVLILPLGFMYFSYLFGLALDHHHDVQRGTFLWYATMNNETITDFPILAPVGKVRFNSIGGDSPNIGTGWQIEYVSKTDAKTVSIRILEYLEGEGYNLHRAGETQFYWVGKHKKNETNELYSGSNQKGESLDLLIQASENGTTQIECSIVY